MSNVAVGVDSSNTGANSLQSNKTIKRVASIDVYRGLVMFLMLAEILHLDKLRTVFDGNNLQGMIAGWIQFNTTHVAWTGCSLHDMIQPSFTFLVGAAMAFSISSRLSKGQSWSGMFWHALGRSAILVLLGIFLRSLGKASTNFTFDDTLTQIGLGYWALFLLSSFHFRGLVVSLTVILLGYWVCFLLYPVPTPDFPYTKVGVPADWPEHWKEGIATHFNKNSNLAWAFDRWWMNLFPREKPFEFSGGGYATLSFIPTLGTMLLGLIAGRLLLTNLEWGRKFGILVAMGAVCLILSYSVDMLGICPIVKRIWTPSWTLWSGGICFLWLAGLSLVCDQYKFTLWAFPFTVIGANSIVAYVMSWTMEKSTHAALDRHFGSYFEWLAEQIVSILRIDASKSVLVLSFLFGFVTLKVFWLILFWLYRNRIFVRI
jgi:heparan-alpha-glucosaminide N-acetyltransferase